MDNFIDIMSKRSDAELLEITTTLRGDYQHDAVTSAENELKKRNLTDLQLADAKAQLETKSQEQEIKKEKIKKLQNKTADIFDTLHPLKEKSTDKTIKLITIGLSIPYLIFFFNNWELTVSGLQHLGDADLSVLQYFAPIVLFPIGLFGFWTLKKFGWTILTILLTYLAITAMVSLALEIKWAMQPPFQFDNNGLLSIQPVDNPALDELLGKKGFAFHIGQIFLLLGILIYLNRQTITEKFKISKRTQLLAIGVTAVPFILFGLTILI